MKKYLLQIALFLIPLLVFFCLLEWQVRKIPNDFNYKSEYLKKHSADLEVLILGSSHSFSFIEPELMQSNAFNAANLHQTLQFDELIFNRFIDKMPKLKTVVLPISYGSYFTTLTEGKDRWRLKDYKRHYDYEGVGFYYCSEVLNGSTPHQIKEVYSYLSSGKNNITCSEKGFGILFARTAQANLEKTGILVAKRHTRECKEDHIDENLKALESIITQCAKRNIRVVLYTAPAYRTYRENVNQELMKKTFSLTEELVRKYPNVIYKNYFSDDRFLNLEFRDVDHLNEQGAKKFTGILKTDAQIQ